MKKPFLLLAFCLVNLLAFSQGSLVSVSPNSSQVGQILSTTITGSGTTFFNSSPQGNIQEVYLQLGGGNTIYTGVFNIIATDDLHANVNISIPAGAPLGVYDLFLEEIDPFTWQVYTLPLPASVTIIAPDGYIQGRIFNDLNQNGIQDGGESGVSGVSLSVTPSLGFAITTDALGDYSAPAPNGNYTVSYSGYYYDQKVIVPGFPSSLPVTINNGNSTGNNFPVISGITSLYPDSAYQGQIITVTIDAKGIFATGAGANGNINNALLYKGATSIGISAANIKYIDNNTATIKFTVPSNAVLGAYSFYLRTLTGQFSGYHYFNNVFKVVTPPLYMKGTVFFDADSDGVKDPSELGMINEKLFLSPDSTFAFTDTAGNYQFGTVPGTHTITWIQQNPFEHLAGTNPASYTATVSSTTSGFDFGLGNNNPLYSSTVAFAPCWAGCVHPNFLRFKIENIGSIAYNGYAYFIKDPGMILYTGGGAWAGDQPDSTSGDTLFFNFNNLAPYATLTISPSFVTPNGGDTIYYSVTIVSLDGPGNNQFYSYANGSHIVNCSMDPNEKSVRPPGVLSQHYTLLTDTLVYTILFQNTGTDTAYTVVIRDTINANLDLNTLEIITSSHTMTTEVPLTSGVLKFSFANILLPDSNTNEARSHGYIVYKIRPKAGTPSGTVVYNKADIYFDFNRPVTTNQTFNTLVTTIPGTPTAEFTSGNQRFCATGSITFSDASANSPTSWQWSFPGGTPATSTAQNPTITYMVKGIYDVTLTATNASGPNTITKAGFITIDSLPLAQIAPVTNQTICLGNSFTLNASSNVAPVSYQWQKNNVDIAGATASSYAATQQAAYRVKITNTGNTCVKLSAPVTVFTQRPTAPITAQGSTIFCSNGSVQLQSSGAASSSFQWLKNNVTINGATSATYSATSYGDYRVRVTDNLGCTNTSRSIPVTVYQNPNVVVSANGPLSFCAGQNVTLSVLPQLNTTYQWTNNGTNINGATQNQYTASSAGKYRVTAINSHSCSNTSSIKNVIVNCKLASPESAPANMEDMSKNDFSVYPSPADNNAHVYFNISQDNAIDISVYDMLGKKVSTLEHASYAAGSYELQMNTENLTNGVYCITLTSNDQLQSFKLIINHN